MNNKVDLFICVENESSMSMAYLYAGQGSGHFTEVNSSQSIMCRNASKSAFADFDNNGDQGIAKPEWISIQILLANYIEIMPVLLLRCDLSPVMKKAFSFSAIVMRMAMKI